LLQVDDGFPLAGDVPAKEDVVVHLAEKLAAVVGTLTRCGPDYRIPVEDENIFNRLITIISKCSVSRLM
jgi:hypothetical protein